MYSLNKLIPFLTLCYFLILKTHAQQCFELHDPGANTYTCISIDNNNNVWVGTDKQGLYSFKNNTWHKSSYLSENKITQIAPDKNGGIWVGQSGRNFQAHGGGVSYIAAGESSETHYTFSFVNNDREGYGLPTSKIQSVAIDSIGRVWAAGSYNNLYVSGVGNYHNPGGVSILTPGADRFNEIASSSMNYSSVGLIDGPRGNNVIPITGSGCIRDCITLAPAKGKMYLGWKGVGDCSYDARIRAFNIPGGGAGLKMAPLYSFDTRNSPFPFSVAISPEAIAVDKSNNIWVGLRAGNGFGVYEYFHELDKTNKWHYVVSDSNNITVNRHAIGVSKKSSIVAIGTDKGLYVYKGEGSIGDLANYQIFNSTNSNIPGDNVTGVAIDNNDQIWITTDNGVASLVLGELEMYTLKTNYRFYDPIYYTTSAFSSDSLRYRISKFGRFSCNNNDETEEYAEIAADGSKSTLFLWKGANADNVALKIKEDVSEDKEEYGYFTLIQENSNSDSVKFLYHHPTHLPTLYSLPQPPVHQIFTIQVVDKTSSEVYYSEKVKIVLPPVLIEHGIFSDKSKLNGIVNHLVETGNYKEYMIRKGGFDKSTIGFSIEAMSYQVREDLNALQQTCAENGLSMGKAIVLGHSTGGLGVRAYTQKMYQENINKFISIHVPHSGSQYVDLLADSRKINLENIIPGLSSTEVEINIGEFIMYPTFFNQRNEGYKDIKDFIPFPGRSGKLLSYYLDRTLPIAPTNMGLYYEREIKTNSEILERLNSSSGLAAEREQNIPTHAIIDNYTYGITGLEVDLIAKMTGIDDLVTAPIQLLKIGGGVAGMFLRYIIVQKASAKTGSTFQDFVIWSASKAGLNKGVSDYVLEKYIFKDLSDGVVSIESQKGGLAPNAISYDTEFDVAHESSKDIKGMENSFDDQLSQLRIFDLVRELPNSDKFTTSGFDPPVLSYDFLEFLGKPARKAKTQRAARTSSLEVGKITFGREAKGFSYMPGDSVEVSITKFNYENALGLVSLYGKNFQPLEAFVGDSTTAIKFQVPANALGEIMLVAEVFDTLNATITLDTLSLNIQLAPGVTIDRIAVDVEQGRDLYTFVDSTTSFQITAFYSDSSVRNITPNAGFKLESVLGNFTVDSLGNITGVEQGLDMLKINYNGLRDSVYVIVSANPFKEKPGIITSNNDEKAKEILVSTFTVYPNPTEDMMKIGLEGFSTSIQLKLINSLGVEVLDATKEVKGNEVSIDANSFSSGIYILLIHDLKTSRTYKKRVLIR